MVVARNIIMHPDIMSFYRIAPLIALGRVTKVRLLLGISSRHHIRKPKFQWNPFSTPWINLPRKEETSRANCNSQDVPSDGQFRSLTWLQLIHISIWRRSHNYITFIWFMVSYGIWADLGNSGSLEDTCLCHSLPCLYGSSVRHEWGA